MKNKKEYAGIVGLQKPYGKIGKLLRKEFSFIRTGHMLMNDDIGYFYEGVFTEDEVKEIRKFVEDNGSYPRAVLSWSSESVANILN